MAASYVGSEGSIVTAPAPVTSPSAPASYDSDPLDIGHLRRLRVLVVHDWLVTWAGSERCVAELLEIFPDADLVVGVKAESMASFNSVAQRARETWLGRLPGARNHHHWFLPLQAAAFATLNTRGYDLVISSSHAFSKMVRTRGDALHVCYCHSPPRYLWDLRESYRDAAKGLQRIAFASAAGMLRRVDRASAGRVDHFIANSSYIADRIRRCYGRQSDVVYPPVASKPVHHASVERSDFLLSMGRLVPYKRVDVAIEAAERSGMRLVVAGDGPERPKLEAMAGRNVEFLGAVSEEEAGRLLSTCAAFMFCAEEDFGIAPVEANAHGAPVIGYAKGGLLETMQSGVTAEFFAEQTAESVAEGIQRAMSHPWDTAALRANAKRFSAEAFRRGVIQVISATLSACDDRPPRRRRKSSDSRS
jgi:glycosyltransferase involved in cell wall biosynthesis